MEKVYTVKVEYQQCGKVYRTRWYMNNELHREDGPAVEFFNGDKSWYKEGKRHREDGPAIENADGSKFWFKEGKRHREDGPACEYTDGDKYWYLDDVNYTLAQYKQEIVKRKNSCGSEASCEGFIVEMNGKKYKLVAME